MVLSSRATNPSSDIDASVMTLPTVMRPFPRPRPARNASAPTFAASRNGGVCRSGWTLPNRSRHAISDRSSARSGRIGRRQSGARSCRPQLNLITLRLPSGFSRLGSVRIGYDRKCSRQRTPLQYKRFGCYPQRSVVTGIVLCDSRGARFKSCPRYEFPARNLRIPSVVRHYSPAASDAGCPIRCWSRPGWAWAPAALATSELSCRDHAARALRRRCCLRLRPADESVGLALPEPDHGPRRGPGIRAR